MENQETYRKFGQRVEYLDAPTGFKRVANGSFSYAEPKWSFEYLMAIEFPGSKQQLPFHLMKECVIPAWVGWYLQRFEKFFFLLGDGKKNCIWEYSLGVLMKRGIIPMRKGDVLHMTPDLALSHFFMLRKKACTADGNWSKPMFWIGIEFAIHLIGKFICIMSAINSPLN